MSAALLLAFAATARPASFDYLYVEANEGGSSGGHAAIRFGDRTYHFQNRDGLLVLDRETTGEFFHEYALLSNRTIELWRVALGDAERDLALARFERHHRVQDRQLDGLAALREDRALLEAWRRGEPGPGVPALGYFEAERRAGSDGERQGSALVGRLLGRIRASQGDDFLARRRAETAAALAKAAAADPGASSIEPPAGVYDEPPFRTSFARRHRAVAAGLAALAVLERRAGLAPGATVRPRGPHWWLEPREIEALDAHALRLEDELVRLAGSPREDWGRPFLIALARRLALEETRESGRFVLLDVLPDDAPRIDAGVVAARPDVVARMLGASREGVERARSAFAGARLPGEREWARLEADASRLHELETAARERRDLRVVRGALIPSRPAPDPSLAAALPERGDLDEALREASEREATYRAALERLHRYGLVTRNCVSEIFHTLNGAFGASPVESERALGGYVDGHRGLAFVPFVSAAAVGREYRVIERRTLASYREQRIAEMKERESGLLVALRESNAFTARSYRRSHRDPWFVFFTDDALLLRPLFGAVNVLAGLGESLWGLARLPFDGGRTLGSGVQGSLASLPELAFGNIRKGSNDFVERDPTPEDASSFRR